MLFLRLNLDYCWQYAIASLENNIIKPKKLMKFLTGSETIPAFGVPTKMEVSFNHGCLESCRCFPTISTCSFSLNIPIHVKYDEEMVTMFGTALLGDVGFGRC